MHMARSPKHQKERGRARGEHKIGNKPRDFGDARHKAHVKMPKIHIDLFGLHAVREAWLNPARRIDALYCTQNAAEAFEEILNMADDQGLDRPHPTIVERETLDRVLPRDAVHQGIALSCDPLDEISVSDILIKTQDADKSVIVLLDQVTDPHNIGAIMRSAAAFGADAVVLQRMHAPEITGTLAKSACGAVEHVPLCFETNLSRTLEALKRAGYTVIGLDEDGRTLLQDYKADEKMVIVLGAEGDGMRRLIRENCDIILRLPTGGPIGTLNVSNAAAVSLFALSPHYRSGT